MAHANKDEGIYIELDCLLDTRLGTVGLLSTTAARELLLSNCYLERQSDVFDSVGTLAYRNLYRDRDVKTLRNSVLTGLIDQHVRGLLKQLLYQAMTQPTHDRIVFDINIFPYSLSEEEKEELSRVIEFRLHGGTEASPVERSLVKVEVVNLRPELLTPAHCRAKYGAMYMYDVGPWLGVQYEALKSLRIPEILVYAPRIYHGKIPSTAEVEELRQLLRIDASDPFTLTEMQLSPIAGVRMLPASYFSSSVRLQSNQATT